MKLKHKVIVWPDDDRIKDHQKEHWIECAREYEDAPGDFCSAWHYVNGHPMFWHCQGYRDGTVSKFVTDSWGFGSTGIRTTASPSPSRLPLQGAAVDVAVVRTDSTGEIRDDEALNTCTRVWLEAGHIVMDPDPEYGFQNVHYHDYELNCGGATYEEAVITLAGLIWERYGNDREFADKED